MFGSGRPVRYWRERHAQRAYVTGYVGVGEKQGGFAAPHLRYAAAVFNQPGDNPYPPYLLWWYCCDTGLIRRVESVHCGARDSRPDAETDARKWAELPGRDDPDFDPAAIGTFDEFDALVGKGFVTYTLNVVPGRPIETPALDLWDFDHNDRRRVALEPANELDWLRS